jgi:Bifunctional DNA primase/polymerase, N-terminal
MNRDELAWAAHRYAEAGWPVFPCRPGSKEPATEHGFLEATTNHRQIDRWWRRNPAANVAIATGAPGPDVLDVDIKPGRSGYTALHRAQRAGLVPGPAAAIRTPSGGAHLYFRGTAQRNGTIPAHALDFRSRGGYVVAPPSFSAERDRRYEVVSRQPVTATVHWSAIRELLDPQPERAGHPQTTRDRAGTVARLARWLETRPEGNRNFPLFYAAKVAAAQGLLTPAAHDELMQASLRSGLRGGEREARRTLASGERAAAHGSHRPCTPVPGQAGDRLDPSRSLKPQANQALAPGTGIDPPGHEAG